MIDTSKLPVSFSFLKLNERNSLLQLIIKIESIADTSQIVVTDQKSLNEAALSISQYKLLEKETEKTRKLITEPLNGLVKEANIYFKNLLLQTPIPAELVRLNREILNYNAAEKKKSDDLRRAEIARLEEDALNKAIDSGKDEPAIIVETIIPEHKLSQQTAYITTTTLKKWRVINITLVPRELFNLDEAAINAVRKSSKADDVSPIPGIEFYSEDSLRAK